MTIRDILSIILAIAIVESAWGQESAPRRASPWSCTVRVSGRAEIRDSGHVVKPLARGVHILEAGCDVRSRDSLSVMVVLAQQMLVKVDRSMDWYPIRRPDTLETAVLRREHVVRELGLRAGRSRSTSTRVVWPASGHPWSAQHSGMIWNADSAHAGQEAALLAEGDVPGDHAFKLGAGGGMVRHPGLNDLIASDGIPSAEVASARYILALFGGGAGISVTPLQLLDPDQNRALAADFAVYVVGDSMDRALGRATAFMRHKLYGDAAIEYEAALALEPEFPELVAKLIDTHRAYGNESRARELVARITRPR